MSANDNTDDDCNEWDDAGFIVASNIRRLVFEEVADGPTTPSTITEAVDHPFSNVSRELGQLLDRGMVEVMNPDSHKGRIYRITDRGNAAMDLVSEMEETA